MPPSLMSKVVGPVTFRSQVTPDYTWDPWAPSAGASGGGVWGWVMREVVRPAVYPHTAAGVVPLEPYGRPSTNLLPAITVGTLATAAVVGGGIFLAGVWWGRRR